MKILIAADLHWPTINGVATFSRNLAQGLADRGHEVVVIAPSQRRSGLRGEEIDGNYTIKRVASVPFPFYQNFRISLAPQMEVKKIIQEFEPDLIHLQMCLTIGNAARKIALKYNIPLVATNHAIPDNLLDNLKILAPMSKPISYAITEYGVRFHAKADYVTLPTQSAIDLFDNARLSIPVEPVSNGIDLSKFRPTEAKESTYEKFSLPRDQAIVTYVGRADAEKHLHVLIQAFRDVRSRTHQPPHLLVVGFGTDLEHLKNLAYEYNIRDHVTFTGRVTDEEIIELHKVGTVFAMPSPAELQSIATLEAMASGKPVVAVDAGALKELCQDSVNGFLCEKDDVDEFADGILQILEDPELAARFSKESLNIAGQHDIKKTLDKFEEIYAKVVKLKIPHVPQRLL